MELELKTHAVNQLPGVYNLGVLFTNARQSDLYEGVSGGPGASDPQGYRSHDRTWFLYTGFNQQVTRHADDVNRGLSVFTAWGWEISAATTCTGLPRPASVTAGCSMRGRTTGWGSASRW